MIGHKLSGLQVRLQLPRRPAFGPVLQQMPHKLSGCSLSAGEALVITCCGLGKQRRVQCCGQEHNVKKLTDQRL